MKKILFILLVLIAAKAEAQYPTAIVIKPNNSFGTQMNRLIPDSTLYLPTACGVPTDTTWLFSQGTNTTYPGWGQKLAKAAIYYDSCGHHEWLWDPSLTAWHIADSIGGPGTAYTADEVSLHLAGTQFSINSTYPGQSSIVNLGPVVSGSWQSTPVADAYIASSANWNAKLGSTLNSAQIFVGNGSNVATGVSMSGAGSLNNTGAFSLTPTGVTGSSCTNCNLSYNAAGQLTLAANGSGGSGGNPFADNTALVMNNADNSRTLTISAANISTGNNRILTAPNFNGIIATTNNAQTFSGVQTLSSAPIFSSLTGYLYGNASSAVSASTSIPTSALSGTLAASQFPALTGQVTTIAGSLATTITANTVTNSNLAQAPTMTIKGNNTGGTANEADLTPSQVVAMLPAIMINNGLSVGFQTGTYAARPAASTCHCYYGATDSAKLYYDNSSWITIGGGNCASCVANSGGAVILGTGTYASLPTASTGTGIYYATDSTQFYYSNGITWSPALIFAIGYNDRTNGNSDSSGVFTPSALALRGLDDSSDATITITDQSDIHTRKKFFIFNQGANLNLTGTITFSQVPTPSVASSINFGSGGFPWQNGYFNNIIAPANLGFGAGSGHTVGMSVGGTNGWVLQSNRQVTAGAYTGISAFTGGTPTYLFGGDASGFFWPIQLGTGLSFTGQTLNSSGGGGGGNFVGQDSVQTDTTSVNTTLTQTAGYNVIVINPSSPISSLAVTLATAFHSSNNVLIMFGGSNQPGGSLVVNSITIIPGAGQTLVQDTNPNGTQYYSGNWLWYHKVGNYVYRLH